MQCKQASNELPSRGDPCEHGRGVYDFPAWIAEIHPGKHTSRLCAVGHHYEMKQESSFTTLFAWPHDLKYPFYLDAVTKEGLNKMELKLSRRMLSCMEVKSVVKAETLLWLKFSLPLRIALNCQETG